MAFFGPAARRLFSTSLARSRTVKEALETLTAQFGAAEVTEPEDSARNLVAGAVRTTNLERLDGALATQELSSDEESRLDVMFQCRLAQMPVQYILKEWDFRGLTLNMRPPVFIPRPETEQLVDLVAAELEEQKKEKGKVASDLKVLEVGCGSGAISLSLLQEHPDLRVTCVDMFSEACILTMENAVRNSLQDRLDVRHARLNPEGRLEGKDAPAGLDALDLVVSNPPYVLRKDLMELAPEIRLYEDLRALDGGKDGLSVILPLLQLCSRVLVPGGRLLLEADPCHAYLLPKVLPERQEDISVALQEVYKDFNQKERFLLFKQPV